MLLGLTTVTLLTGESAVKGYISMVLGLMIAMVGFDIISGDPRYAFGVPELMDGIDFLPVAIGLFGIGEVLAGAESRRRRGIVKARYGLRDVMPNAQDWVRSRWAIARGTRARLSRRHPAGRRADGLDLPVVRAREEGLEAPRGVRPRRDRGRRRPRVGQQRGRDRRDGADADARHPRLGDDRDHARRADDVGPAARAAAVREEPASSSGA